MPSIRAVRWAGIGGTGAHDTAAPQFGNDQVALEANSVERHIEVIVLLEYLLCLRIPDRH